jgi:hypothetical protein
MPIVTLSYPLCNLCLFEGATVAQETAIVLRLTMLRRARIVATGCWSANDTTP